MQIKFTNQIRQEGKMFVAYCSELDISTCGKSLEEAKKNIVETTELFFEEAKKMGTLNDILKESGFIKQTAQKKVIWQSPEILSLEKLSLAI
ncbi:hypothetical protein HY750_03035 [Candidatus Kuenenbacteria bacterium]|nr:hypothetical protein [Candidatus Kuenenbacteria bacterium]